jgi:hypothetical protein
MPSIKVAGLNGAVVTVGSSLAISVANGPGNARDWVGLAQAGSADTNYTSWVYLDGLSIPPAIPLKSATVVMTAPNVAGSYEARFYLNDGYTVLARTTFTVGGATVPSPPAPPSPAQSAVGIPAGD